MNYEWQKVRFSVINDIMNDIVNDQKGHNIVNESFVHKMIIWRKYDVNAY